MIALRPYQREAVEAVFDYWRGGGENPLVEAATGTGKSLIIATLVRELLESWPDMRVMMLVHVRELVEQNARALQSAWPAAPVGINSAGLGRRDWSSRILFASIQSVYKSADRLGPRDLVIIDEAHLVPRGGDGMYRHLLDRLRDAVPDLRVAGFTATPYRLDSGRLDVGRERVFSEVVYSYGIGRGIADGYLSPLVSKATVTKLDVSGVARRGGEFVQGALEEAVDKENITRAAVAELAELGRDRQSWLLFGCGVTHALHLRDEVRRHGISCETVTGETPAGERAQIIRDFRQGRLRCLTNCSVLTTGFDAPGVDLVAMLRPTLSTGLYVQIVGRGTRLADGKQDCLVLDYAGNVRRHGPVDAIVVKGGPRDKEKDPDEKAKECPECSALVGLSARSCPCCGYEWNCDGAPPPRHEARADAQNVILSTQAPPWLPVTDWHFREWRKPGKPTSLRVDFYCGLSMHSAWICLEHGGFASEKAAKWWRDRGGGAAPLTVREAMGNLDLLKRPAEIRVRKNGKFTEIVGYRSAAQLELAVA